jgi:hypothetical protein
LQEIEREGEGERKREREREEKEERAVKPALRRSYGSDMRNYGAAGATMKKKLGLQ